jgi:hypothetical protein
MTVLARSSWRVDEGMEAAQESLEEHKVIRPEIAGSTLRCRSDIRY